MEKCVFVSIAIPKNIMQEEHGNKSLKKENLLCKYIKKKLKSFNKVMFKFLHFFCDTNFIV